MTDSLFNSNISLQGGSRYEINKNQNTENLYFAKRNSLSSNNQRIQVMGKHLKSLSNASLRNTQTAASS